MEARLQRQIDLRVNPINILVALVDHLLGHLGSVVLKTPLHQRLMSRSHSLQGSLR